LRKHNETVRRLSGSLTALPGERASAPHYDAIVGSVELVAFRSQRRREEFERWIAKTGGRDVEET
jgi:hypothetical protein